MIQSCTDIPDCMTAEEIRMETLDYAIRTSALRLANLSKLRHGRHAAILIIQK